MNIQFEKISTRESRTGARANSLASHAPNTQGDSNVIQLAGRPPAQANRLHGTRGKTDHASIHNRSEFTQAFLDALAILFAFLFVTVTGLGITAAIFAMLFVSF